MAKKIYIYIYNNITFTFSKMKDSYTPKLEESKTIYRLKSKIKKLKFILKEIEKSNQKDG